MKKFFSLFLALLTVSSSLGVVTSGVSEVNNVEESLAAEANDRVLGDIDADRLVDINDAVVLFRSCMLPDLYSIDYPGTVDFTNDGAVNLNDAVWLFRHSMLPDQFPIYWENGEREPEETDITTDDPSEAAAFISLADLKKYTIIRSEEASNAVKTASYILRNKLTPLVGSQLNLETDSDPSDTSEYEILIGKCDREESRQFSDDLKLFDYGYTVIGKKLVISGGSDQATSEAIYAFIEAVLRKCTKETEVFFSDEDTVVVRRSYEISDVTLQGSPISEYTVVYPHDSDAGKNLANQFIWQFAMKAGTVLKVRSDAEPASGKEILIGAVNRPECSAMTSPIEDGTYKFGAEGSYVYALGDGEVGNYYAMDALLKAILEPSAQNQEVVLASAVVNELPAGDSLKAMSFNLWISEMTTERMESVRQTIISYMPDTIGVQEGDPEWMIYLDTVLGSVYDYVGFGRDGGSDGEHSAIFYKRDRFELIETETKWLSDTPDVVSKFDDAGMRRVMTYAILRDKNTNRKILVANTHLDHQNSSVRGRQVKVLLDILQNYTEYPIVLTGDFNAGLGSNVYNSVTEYLADSCSIAESGKRQPTYHNYGNPSAYLDYAFVSEDKIKVTSYRVITKKMNGMLPSDHYPLIIEYSLLP